MLDGRCIRIAATGLFAKDLNGTGTATGVGRNDLYVAFILVMGLDWLLLGISLGLALNLRKSKHLSGGGVLGRQFGWLFLATVGGIRHLDNCDVVLRVRTVRRSGARRLGLEGLALRSL